MTRGGLCVKLKDYHDHHYNPDRVLYPLAPRRAQRARGSSPASRWDEAIAEITTRWKDIIARHGSQAIMPYSYLGNEGLVQGLTAGDAFFNRLGSTVNEKTFCASGSSTAWLLTVGPDRRGRSRELRPFPLYRASGPATRSRPICITGRSCSKRRSAAPRSW